MFLVVIVYPQRLENMLTSLFAREESVNSIKTAFYIFPRHLVKTKFFSRFLAQAVLLWPPDCAGADKLNYL